jgi:hypothetical protein
MKAIILTTILTLSASAFSLPAASYKIGHTVEVTPNREERTLLISSYFNDFGTDRQEIGRQVLLQIGHDRQYIQGPCDHERVYSPIHEGEFWLNITCPLSALSKKMRTKIMDANNPDVPSATTTLMFAIE